MSLPQPVKLIGPFRQVLTMEGIPLHGAVSDDRLVIHENAGILCQGDRIESIGKFDHLASEISSMEGEVEEINQELVVLPGLIDAHTHICFGGSRAMDFAMRNAGQSYLEIARKGGGIWSTVTNTREASKEELVNLLNQRVRRHLLEGITTMEVKSGYGLSIEEELKMLEAIAEVNDSQSADLIPTCLAAHMLPKDFEGGERKYLEHLVESLLPLLKERQLSKRIDIFIEKTAFNPGLGKSYLMDAKKMGFDLTVHADQFSTGGSEVAIACGALSADHLEASTEKEIKALAKSKTIGVALPGASLGLGMAFTPARKLLDAGAALAIASDWNPGSAPMGDLIMQAAVLATYEKLSSAEVFAGITSRAAKVLNLEDRGILETGKLADFVAFPTNDFMEILYHQGKMKPELVWKSAIQQL